METTAIHRDIRYTVRLQQAYKLLCLLRRPLAMMIMEVLSLHQPYELTNWRLVLHLNRLGRSDRMYPQSEVSVMLSMLKKKGIIIVDKKGKWVHYALDSDRLDQISGAIHRFMHPE